MKIECSDKYTWVFDEGTGVLSCLRYGEKWRDAVGDGAILALLQKCDELQTSHNSDTDAVRKIRAIIKDRGDTVTKVLKIGDILSQHH